MSVSSETKIIAVLMNFGVPCLPLTALCQFIDQLGR